MKASVGMSQQRPEEKALQEQPQELKCQVRQVSE